MHRLAALVVVPPFALEDRTDGLAQDKEKQV